MKTLPRRAWDKTKTLPTKAWDKTKIKPRRAWDKTKTLPDKAWEATKTLPEKAWDKMKTLPDEAQARGKQSNKQNNNQTLKTIEESNNLTINESNKQPIKESNHPMMRRCRIKTVQWGWGERRGRPWPPSLPHQTAPHPRSWAPPSTPIGLFNGIHSNVKNAYLFLLHLLAPCGCRVLHVCGAHTGACRLGGVAELIENGQ